MRNLALALAVIAVSNLGCSVESASESDDLAQKKATENWARDIVATDLNIDVATHHGTATLTLASSTRTGASFEVEGLTIQSVSDDHGPVTFAVHDGQLDLGLAAHKTAEVTIEYGFKERARLEGAMKSGATFLWPHFCGNLFPCKSAPDDGVRFSLGLTGVDPKERAVFPSSIPSDAPSYMIAWAIGDYTQKKLGATTAGTHVSVFYRPGEAAKAIKGTANLTKIFDWYERTYGAYLFGDDVASVSVTWGSGGFGGMEHHPYWHVSAESMDDEETHAHEAAHGWFGDGVRLQCWEDLTLSEGTVSYLAARSMEAVSGAKAGDAVWADYQARLDEVVKTEDRLALPDSTCDEIDVLKDLWNDVPYMKGAFFYRAVEKAVGRKALDAVIASFYKAHRAKPARMQDMIDRIQADTGFDAKPLAKAWLRSLGAPKP